jgi:hypothetical protein
MKCALLVLAVLVSSSIASAQLTSIPPFTGTQSESFEGITAVNTPCIPSRIFNNTGDLCTPGSNGCIVSGGWGFMCQISAHNGSAFFGSSSTAGEVTFDQPVARFGGWFGTNSGTPDATFTFYDALGNVIASQLGSVPADCAWHWLGWDVGAGTPIKRVLCSSVFGGGFLDMDDLEYAGPSTPPPTAYCTAGTSSNGCVPSISANANPSLTFAHACNLSIANMEGQKTGIVFYGVNQTGFTPHPWATGSNSYLCVKSPTQRTGVHNTGGTLNQCDGALVFDWNAYQLANPSALGNPFVVGQKIYAQGWYRDPLAAKTTNLSNALEMTCVP